MFRKKDEVEELVDKIRNFTPRGHKNAAAFYKAISDVCLSFSSLYDISIDKKKTPIIIPPEAELKNGIAQKIASDFTKNDFEKLGSILKLAMDEKLIKIQGERQITNLLYQLMESLAKKNEIIFEKKKP